MQIKDSEILITGGTGSLGNALVKQLADMYPRGIRIFSRGEDRQWRMEQETIELNVPIGFYLGDVRDKERVIEVAKGVDVIIHTAALKQVPKCEMDPNEAIKTNINGAQNVIAAAIQNDVKEVVNISTDKAVASTNLYGATKAVAEKLFVHAKTYTGDRGYPQFYSCRYGNVLGSNGSIFKLFKEQMEKLGYLTITDKRMTRFFITLENVAAFIISRIESLWIKEGIIFIPRMKSAWIEDIMEAFGDVPVKDIGIRRGEKVHEELITLEESRRLVDLDSLYILSPEDIPANSMEGTVYSSLQDESNKSLWWTKKELQEAMK